MASPGPAAPAPAAAPPALPNGHPSTPPPSDTAPSNPQPASQPQPQPPQPQQLSVQPPPQPSQQQQQQPHQPPDPEVPLTSLQTDDTAKKPRDMKLIHLVLHAQGISSYQERVPLQLLDFAYRYTSTTLSDALRLSADGYAGAPERTGGRGGGKGGAGGAGADAGGEGITVQSLRQAIASRSGVEGSWRGYLPKEFMLEQAEERNRLALPKVQRAGGGVQLPPEKYCLTGSAWNLKEEWESEGEEEGEKRQDGKPLTNGNGHGHGESRRRSRGNDDGEDEKMGGMEDMQGGDEDEEGMGRMEDVFGEEGGDTQMEE
ncbi:hypothetical protein KC354_g2747 [Hortaea werneckii]|nr:hypothetical protein KC354_g2747 [Hortaea werneckii]